VSNKDLKGLEVYGLTNLGEIKKNLTAPELYEEIIKNGEGTIANGGAMVCLTGAVTGRSPNDKFIVEEDTTKTDVNWSKGNVPISKEKFNIIYNKLLAYLQTKDVYVQECYAGADETSRIKVRVINEFAWQNLFIRNMFIQEPDASKLENFMADFSIICCPNFKAAGDVDGVNSENFVILNFEKKIVIVGGTAYAGEMKK